MGRDSALFKHIIQVDFEEIRANGSASAKQVLSRISESGLEHFLGSPFILYQEAVEEFFKTASLTGRKITATVSGQQLELTEESVVDILRLPSEGTNLPATLDQETFKAAFQILAETKVPVGVSRKKSSLRPEYRPLCDIFTKSVQARGGNYDSLTQAKIEMLVGLVNGVRINWAKQNIRSRQFTERKSNRKASGSTGGRRKKAAVKKTAPVKEIFETKKDKQPIEYADPRSETPNEEDSASNSDRTVSHNTEENQSGKGQDRISDDQLASLDNADTGADGLGEEDVHANDNTQEMAENIVSRIMEEINQQGREASEKNTLREHRTLNYNSAVQAVKITETTKDDLGEAVKRITSVETNYGNTDVLYGSHLDRTKALEDMIPKLVDDLESVSQKVAEMERSQEKTEQRLTKVDEDLARSSAQAGSTLGMIISLEEKNASLEERNTKLEANLKAVTEQVTELITTKLAADKATEEANALAARQHQDALDEETLKQKEAVATDANIAAHIQKNSRKCTGNRKVHSSSSSRRC
ncbi:uncharacterized protein LOC124929521 [Impatiens glandulifera]|uniref:uncharacterized protein LOC124929521 n=1 Tax=Impatiens glandulifera TaxID=253017 RepID=UPI001FB0B44A|nr:uncharacterized protein LOC124929521 [Impatiens glandulifera]